MEKRLAIANVIIDAAREQVALARGLRKKARFYNKHSTNKRAIIAQMNLELYMRIFQIYVITQQPVLKRNT